MVTVIAAVVHLLAPTGGRRAAWTRYPSTIKHVATCGLQFEPA